MPSHDMSTPPNGFVKELGNGNSSTVKRCYPIGFCTGSSPAGQPATTVFRVYDERGLSPVGEDLEAPADRDRSGELLVVPARVRQPQPAL